MSHEYGVISPFFAKRALLLSNTFVTKILKCTSCGSKFFDVNVSNNQLYLKAIQENNLPYEQEVLSVKDQYNEYLMTGLRTIDGVSLAYVRQTFGLQYGRYLEEQAERHFDSRNFYWDGDFMKISKKAKFLTDGIAADLFMV